MVEVGGWPPPGFPPGEVESLFSPSQARPAIQRAQGARGDPIIIPLHLPLGKWVNWSKGKKLKSHLALYLLSNVARHSHEARIRWLDAIRSGKDVLGPRLSVERRWWGNRVISMFLEPLIRSSTAS